MAWVGGCIRIAIAEIPGICGDFTTIHGRAKCYSQGNVTAFWRGGDCHIGRIWGGSNTNGLLGRVLTAITRNHKLYKIVTRLGKGKVKLGVVANGFIVNAPVVSVDVVR